MSEQDSQDIDKVINQISKLVRREDIGTEIKYCLSSICEFCGKTYTENIIFNTIGLTIAGVLAELIRR